MKIVIIGAEGTMGKAVVAELAPRHEIIKVGRRSGDYHCDIKDPNSIRALFDSIGRFDALICAAGHVHFAPLDKMTPELFQIGLQDKLMGQVNLVLIGREYINDRGSFTLISGIVSRDPIASGCSASLVDGALDAFVRAAAIELDRGIRINGISPTILTESVPKFGSYFRGFAPVPASRVALEFSKSVEGLQTGQIYEC